MALTNRPSYIHDRLNLALQNTQDSDFQSISLADEYLKSSDGNYFFRFFDMSLLIQKKEKENKTVTNEERQKSTQIYEKANLKNENLKNINILAKQLLTTNAIKLINQHLAKESGRCSKLNFIQK